MSKTQRMGLKFRQWVHQEEEEDKVGSEEDELFTELSKALEQVKYKLLSSRKKLAHEFEQAKALMSSLQEAVVAIDLDSRCLFFNSSFAVAFLEGGHLEKFSDRQLLLFQALRHDFLSLKIKEVFEKRSPAQLECRLLHKANQQSRDYVVKISPLFEERAGDEIYGALIVFHDVTELKESERNKLLFVENASHELRTPLTSVKGYIDLALVDLEKNLPIKVWLEQAKKGVQRLVDLVEDLLQLAVLDKNPKLNKDWINPVEVTERVFNLLALQASEKKMTLKVSSEIPLIFLDESKVEQILINLVSNSIRYNGEGTIVTVTWVNNGNPQLVVSDDGVGIPEAHWGKLFERFYRVDQGRNREQGGTGLGLAIVKQLVEIQGGSITVGRPDNGKGIAFIISWPPSSR
ncbi:MAG: ATP-binding protein [Bdellovibrionaceae bacterium]|nr:ATP-binding protein [Pseudobdellovibrionaceae bacterium]MDW8189591.1 ATP-binding protein [Pseudobdellovibrionaceae bacterium]